MRPATDPCWACLQVQAVTCSQLMSVLQLLGRGGQSRCSVIVALWSKLLDRHNLVKVRGHLQGLAAVELDSYAWHALLAQHCPDRAQAAPVSDGLFSAAGWRRVRQPDPTQLPTKPR